jgi:hypothetical protein
MCSNRLDRLCLDSTFLRCYESKLLLSTPDSDGRKKTERHKCRFAVSSVLFFIAWAGVRCKSSFIFILKTSQLHRERKFTFIFILKTIQDKVKKRTRTWGTNHKLNQNNFVSDMVFFTAFQKPVITHNFWIGDGWWWVIRQNSRALPTPAPKLTVTYCNSRLVVASLDLD